MIKHASLVQAAFAGDLLLQNKEDAELLQSYEERQDAAVKFIQAVRPELRVQTAALKDPQVTSCILFPFSLLPMLNSRQLSASL